MKKSAYESIILNENAVHIPTCEDILLLEGAVMDAVRTLGGADDKATIVKALKEVEPLVAKIQQKVQKWNSSANKILNQNNGVNAIVKNINKLANLVQSGKAQLSQKIKDQKEDPTAKGALGKAAMNVANYAKSRTIDDSSSQTSTPKNNKMPQASTATGAKNPKIVPSQKIMSKSPTAEVAPVRGNRDITQEQSQKAEQRLQKMDSYKRELQDMFAEVKREKDSTKKEKLRNDIIKIQREIEKLKTQKINECALSFSEFFAL